MATVTVPHTQNSTMVYQHPTSNPLLFPFDGERNQILGFWDVSFILLNCRMRGREGFRMIGLRRLRRLVRIVMLFSWFGGWMLRLMGRRSEFFRRVCLA